MRHGLELLLVAITWCLGVNNKCVTKRRDRGWGLNPTDQTAIIGRPWSWADLLVIGTARSRLGHGH